MSKTDTKTKKTSKNTSAPIQNWAGLIYTLVSAVIVITGTYAAIRWAQGDFRVDESADSLARETGLLHATSTPKAAEIYIDGKLTAVTDDTIYLSPGEYDIRISKDGYSTWSKHILIEKSLVSATNATLYPYSPSISSITYTGVKNPLASPDGSKILYYTNTASAKSKNGLYVLDATNTNRSPQQICDDDPDYDLEHATIVWSPDSNEVLVVTTTKTLLLNTSRFVNLQSSPDVSLQLRQTLDAWEADLALREQQFAQKVPTIALNVIRTHAKNLFLSPDQTKILYTATASATLPDGLIAALPAPNSQPEIRQLEPNQLYIYDAYEDRNYPLGEASATSSAKLLLTSPLAPTTRPFASPANSQTITHSLQTDTLEHTLTNFANYYGTPLTQAWMWLPDSKHLVAVIDDQITITDYDGANQTAVYSGPLQDGFILPAPKGDAILTLANFNPGAPDNIYAIELTK